MKSLIIVLVALFLTYEGFAQDNDYSFRRLSCVSEYASATIHLDLYYNSDSDGGMTGEITGVFWQIHNGKSTVPTLVRDINYKTSSNDHLEKWHEHYSFSFWNSKYSIKIHPAQISEEKLMIGVGKIQIGDKVTVAPVICFLL